MEVINFGKGHPSGSLLPREEVLAAVADLLEPNVREYDDDSQNNHPLNYGTNSGSLWVRQAICDFMNRKLVPSVKSVPEYLNLTGGASYGLLNILIRTTNPSNGTTRRAFMVTPTYFLVNDMFLDAGFKGLITAVPQTPFGVDINTLRNYIIEEEKKQNVKDVFDGPKKYYRYVIYVVPTFANPTGDTYTLSNRMALIELARQYDMLIISDDVYDLLDYGMDHRRTPPRLVFLDRESASSDSYGNTISNCTFSKIIAPGLRCGYQESVNELLVAQLAASGANVSGGTPSQFCSMVVGRMLSNGSVDELLNLLNRRYASRAKALYSAIRKYLPPGTRYTEQEGGYFSWCTLPLGFDCRLICEALIQRGVLLANGDRFEVVDNKKGWGARSVRLSISYLTEQEIEEGVKIWGEVCKEHMTLM